MGVHGLWRLIEPSGRPVPLETLENKVLAVDVSIWLHQLVKGYQDAHGGAVPNAHLLGVYHRICKLLYFRIKPVFVFDGGVPNLKKETISKRQKQRSRDLGEAERLQKTLLDTLLKHSSVSKVLSEKAKAALSSTTSPIKKSSPIKSNNEDNLYALPPLAAEFDSTLSSSDEEYCNDNTTSDTESSSPSKHHWDLHSIDTKSDQFKSLPVDVRHEILTDLKETRKQSSWGRIHELPSQSDDFSVYQMGRLLKRQAVQNALEEAEKEMGGHTLSLAELEQLLKEQGVISNVGEKPMLGNRIASDDSTRYLLIKDLKQAIEDAKKQQNDISEEIIVENDDKSLQHSQDEDEALKQAIALSLQDEPSTSKTNNTITTSKELPETNVCTQRPTIDKKKKLQLSFLQDFEFDSDTSEENDEVIENVKKFGPAETYMMEYGGLNATQIAEFIGTKKPQSKTTLVGKLEATSTTENEKIIDNSLSNREDKVETEPTTKTLSQAEHEIGNDEKENNPESEESTDDDFLEVQTNNPKKEMEIVIRTDQDVHEDDDLFADVFNCPIEPKIGETDLNNEKGEIPLENPEIPQKVPNGDTTKIESEAASSLKSKIEDIIVKYSKKDPKKSNEVQKNTLTKLSVDTLQEIKDNLSQEGADIGRQMQIRDRMATNITDQITKETQELLQLFGIPYIIAPMEAESQCAFLEIIGLTDGTITDDSDIWLFGGKTVYKNFFNHQKQVMEFRSQSIQDHFKLTRHQMVLFALLVGSDYTLGLTGVGPVTALEILASFPPKSLDSAQVQDLLTGLSEFRNWVKKGKIPGPGRSSLRSKLKNLCLTDAFPSVQVVQAYLDPRVETSDERFSWGTPNIIGLGEYARRKFGWTASKSEKVLQPVIKRLTDTKTQTTLRDFFKTTFKVDSDEAQNKMSKRVKTALSRLGNSEFHEDEVEEKPKQKVKKGESSKKKVTRKRVKKDEEIVALEKTEELSRKRVKEIEEEANAQLEGPVIQRKPILRDLHKKEVIPQRQKDKAEMMKNKFKAIEIFRKSKRGPGFVKKGAKLRRPLEEDAGLSESSSDGEK